MRKGRLILTMLILVLTLIPTLIPTYALNDETVEIVLHKRMYVDPNAIPNFKISSGLLEPVGDDTYGFNGVEFTIFDISDYRAKSDEDFDSFAQRLSNHSIDSLVILGETEGHLVERVITTTQQKEAGIAKIRVDGKRHQAYLILETKTPKIQETYEVIHKATPMLVVLPVEDPTNKEAMLSTIHLYPKNFGYRPEVLPQTPNPEVRPPELGGIPPTGRSSSNFTLAHVLIGVGLFILVVNKGKISKEENYENAK